MKLYFTPGTCSLSPHIALREADIPFELVKVDSKTKKLPDGTDYKALNAKGYVPCLELDSGERITEGPAIVQFIADLAPGSALAPPPGTLARVRMQEWLNFVTSELHKGFSPLFASDTPENYKPIARQKLATRLALVDSALLDKQFLTGDTFTVADAYLFVVLGWSKHVNVDISEFQNIGAFVERMSKRPKVRAAMLAEGLH
jgi:glutathione S-transferase